MPRSNQDCGGFTTKHQLQADADAAGSMDWRPQVRARPKLVAAALGFDPQAPLIYLADRIHHWPQDALPKPEVVTSEHMKTDAG